MAILPPRAFDPAWSTALPDWQDRLRAGASLVPELPLYSDQAEKALRIFKRLRVYDIEGQPTFGEAFGQWVFDFVAAVFGAYDETSKRRMLQDFFMLVPKKNGKTTICAGIMMTAAIMNQRPGAELLLIAPTQEVAKLAFKAIRGMVKLDPSLDMIFHVQDHSKQITHRNSGAEIAIKSSDTGTITGVKATYILIDELHEFSRKSQAADVLTELRGALAARPDGFLLKISTQSKAQPAGVFRQELLQARAVRDGELALPLLAVLYELPPEMQTAEAWRDPATWPMVNPSYGRSVNPDFLAEKLTEAEGKGKEELRLFVSQHFNVEIGVGLTAETWIGAAFWEDCGDPQVTLGFILDRSDVVTVGIDGGGLDDLLGFAVIGRERDTRDWLVWTHAWAQPEVLERRKDIVAQLTDYAADGDLTLCAHAGQGHQEVADLVERVADSGLLPVAEAVGLDQALSAPILDALAGRRVDGALLCGVRQGGGLRGPIWNMEHRLKARSVRHGARPMMNWVLGNAKTEQVGSMVVIEKKTAGKAKIDPLIAILNAAELMGRNPVAGNGGVLRIDSGYRVA